LTTSQDVPSFNLKVVVQQTGLKPDTLRAWERRYGLPQPQRSPGGHRLFSKRDIRTVKWLMARQAEGLSIKRAVEMWRRLEAEEKDPLQAVTSAPSSSTAVPTPRLTDSAIAQLREDWLAACMAFDEQRSEQVLSEAFALYPPETVCLELLREGLSQVGERWYRGEATVQQEHFISELAIRRLESLIMATPPPIRLGRILAACPPQERHTFGLLLLTFLLRRQGWDVLYLGADVPLDRMKVTIDRTKPQLAILAAQLLYTAATTLHMAERLGQEQIPIAYGGLIFNLLPALRTRIPGHFLGETLQQAAQVVEQLMAGPRSLPKVELASAAYHQAQEHFCERQPHIEEHLAQNLEATSIAPDHLALANRELARNIEAALTLGDMDFLGADIEWIRGLLTNYALPAESLQGYLRAYCQAAQAHLDERGEPIVVWLVQCIDK
jgi:DNA-binding transcriptional MerR regulator